VCVQTYTRTIALCDVRTRIININATHLPRASLLNHDAAESVIAPVFIHYFFFSYIYIFFYSDGSLFFDKTNGSLTMPAEHIPSRTYIYIRTRRFSFSRIITRRREKLMYIPRRRLRTGLTGGGARLFRALHTIHTYRINIPRAREFSGGHSIYVLQ